VAANQPARKKAILAALKVGNTRRAACLAVGVTADTLYRWMRDDQTFSDAVAAKEAEAEMECVKVIRGAAADGIWTAAAWWLERNPRTKNDWRRSDELDLRKLTVEQLLELERACAGGDESPGDRLALAESSE